MREALHCRVWLSMPPRLDALLATAVSQAVRPDRKHDLTTPVAVEEFPVLARPSPSSGSLQTGVSHLLQAAPRTKDGLDEFD